MSIGQYIPFKDQKKEQTKGPRKLKIKEKLFGPYLSSSGSSSLSFNHITVGSKVESCFIIHSNETWPYL